MENFDSDFEFSMFIIYIILLPLLMPFVLIAGYLVKLAPMIIGWHLLDYLKKRYATLTDVPWYFKLLFLFLPIGLIGVFSDKYLRKIKKIKRIFDSI